MLGIFKNPGRDLEKHLVFPAQWKAMFGQIQLTLVGTDALYAVNLQILIFF